MRLRSPPLFWRTLLLVLLLIVLSLTAWLQSFRVFERAPRAATIAQQIVSIAQLTRAALIYADPYIRRDLLTELARNEGIRIAPLEASDVVKPLPERSLLRLSAPLIAERLGPGTQVVAQVNGVDGVWVSLSIDEDRYWLYIDRDPVARNIGTQWIGWAVIALILSVLGAILITRVINRPLAQLSAAAEVLGRGMTPPLLPATGPVEIRTVNESFNRMVSDLGKLEEDRAVLLAGISHDLRTPLTRLRLEIEMAGVSDDARAGMIADLEQMDAIVRQFLDYARRAPQQPRERIELAPLIEAAVVRARLESQPDTRLQLRLAPVVTVEGFRTELDRALDNLLMNAIRYGHDPNTGTLDLTVSLATDGQDAVIAVADLGPGVPAEQIDRLLRPFERGDAARSGSGGAGLGLPIVQRIARVHGGALRLLANSPHGLRAELTLPLEHEA
jgi:two-component system osmolarity sensor histidine kinase EnvZ